MIHSDIMVSDPSKSLFRRINIYLIGSLIALNLIGLVNLLSATTNIARHLRGVFNDQMIWISLGWLLIFFITAIGYRVFIRLAYVIYALNILALIAVMVIGKVPMGPSAGSTWVSLIINRLKL